MSCKPVARWVSMIPWDSKHLMKPNVGICQGNTKVNSNNCAHNRIINNSKRLKSQGKRKNQTKRRVSSTLRTAASQKTAVEARIDRVIGAKKDIGKQKDRKEGKK